MGKNVLIIGAGPAGLAAAEAAAASGASVTLAGAEPYPPYWRPRLTRCLAEPAPVETLSIRRREWYAAHGVELITGRAAERIDAAGRQVYWAGGGEPSGFDALVAATGSSPATPKIEGVENALTLRTYGDALKIRETALARGRATVIGGGLLGLETACELAAAGVKVTVIERSPWLLPRQLNREAGEYLRRKLEATGVAFITGQEPNTLGGLYQGACVVIAAGVRANLDALAGSGVAINRGVLVDECMRTNTECVYACGDAAEYNGKSWGLLSVAQEQGRVAGVNAAGGDAIYAETPPSPVLKAGPVNVFSTGEPAGGEGSALLGGETPSGYACVVLKEGVVAGAALVGDTKAGMKLKKAIIEKREFKNAKTINDILSAI